VFNVRRATPYNPLSASAQRMGMLAPVRQSSTAQRGTPSAQRRKVKPTQDAA